jgi:uncharacterized protein YndB with AHSA1/START domain
MTIEPLALDFTVACTPEHAFATWATRTSAWWPASHSETAAAGLTVTFEPRGGGRIYERTPAGEEHDWGEVLVWEPPHRLAYSWHLRQDRRDATRVERTPAAPIDSGRRQRARPAVMLPASPGPLAYHWRMPRTQTIVQLSEQLLAELDARRAREGRSRSELIREAIEAYLASDRRKALDEAIVAGYARIPPNENLGATWATRASITAEPWDFR